MEKFGNEWFDSQSIILTEEIAAHTKIKAQELLKSGDHHLRICHYREAIINYTKALELDFIDINADLSWKLFESRSNAHMESGNYAQALDDGCSCVNIKPLSYTGYFRIGKAKACLGNYGEALEMLPKAMQQIDASEGSNKMYILGDISVVLCKSPEYIDVADFQDLQSDLWPDVIQMMSKLNKWKAIHTVFLGKLDFGFEGIITHCDLKDKIIYLADLYHHCTKEDLLRWGHALLKKLIRCGVSPWRLAAASQCPCGALWKAYEIGIVCENFWVLKKLLSADLITCQESKKCTNKNIDTLYHKVLDDPDKELLALLSAQRRMHISYFTATFGFFYKRFVDLRSLVFGTQHKRDVHQLTLDKENIEDFQGSHDSLALFELYRTMAYNLQVAPQTEKNTAGISKGDEAAVYLKIAERSLKNGFTPNDLRKAEEMTKKASRCHNTWFKVYKVQVELLEKSHRSTEAYYTLWKEVETASSSNAEKVQIMINIVKIGLRNPESTRYKKPEDFSEIWIKVMEHFAASDMWDHVRYVLDRWHEQDTYLFTICYKPLLKLSRSEWVKWGEQLVLDILSCGGNLEYLTLKDKDMPLHAALDMAFFSGSTKLLEYLLQSKPYMTVEDVNRPDGNGNGVVHAMVHSYVNFTPDGIDQKVLFINIRDILKRSCVNPILLDAKGRLPTAFISPRMECYDILKNWIEDRQENLRLKIMDSSTSVQQGATLESVSRSKHLLSKSQENVIEKANLLIKKAQLYKREHELGKAIALCREADQSLVYWCLNPFIAAGNQRRIASMYQFMADSLWQLNELSTSLQYAWKFKDCDPNCFEAHDLLVNIMLSFPIQKKTYEVFLQGLILAESQKYHFEVKVKYLDAIIFCYNELSRKGEDWVPCLLKESVIPIEYWVAITEGYAQCDQWPLVDFAIQEGKLNIPSKDKDVIADLMDTDIFEWLKYKERLVVLILKCTADVTTVLRNNVSLLQRAVHKAETSGSTLLLECLVVHKTYREMSILQELDKDGLGVLHWLSQYYKRNPAKDPKIQQKIYNLFEEKGMDPQYLDHNGKKAADHCNKSNETFQILKRWTNRFRPKQKALPPEEMKLQNVEAIAQKIDIEVKKKQQKIVSLEEMCEYLNTTNETMGQTRSKKSKGRGHSTKQNFVAPYIDKIVQDMVHLVKKVKHGKSAVIPDCVLCVKGFFLTQIMEKASKDWEVAYSLLKAYKEKNTRSATNQTEFDRTICSKVSLKTLVEGLQDNTKDYDNIKECLKLMIQFDAKQKVAAAEVTMKKGHYDLIDTFLDLGVSLKVIRHYQNATEISIHSALIYGLEETHGSFHILEKMLQLYRQEPQVHPEFDPNTQDKEGNTILHIAARHEFSKSSVEAMKMLLKYNADPTLKNKKGKIPMKFLNYGDDRYELMKETLKRKPFMKQLKKDLRINIEELLSGIDVTNINPLIFEEKNDSSTDEDSEVEEENVSFIAGNCVAKDSTTSEDGHNGRKNDLPLKDDIEDETEETESIDQMEQLIGQMFDGLPWEVECTNKVLKFLRNKTNEKKIILRILTEIRRLAMGEWRKPIVKRLKGVGEMELYEIKLDKGARIVLETAIAFSPRLTAKQNEHSGEIGQGDKVRIRVYTQVIRIWDIILLHDNLNRGISKILKSFQQGRTCHIKFKLKGLSKTKEVGKVPAKEPAVFFEASGNESEDDTFVFFPPAISKKKQPSVLKMYSLSSTMADYFLQDTTIPAEFPFKETELEHDIIEMNPSQNEPIILHGRSGTGKTTCCLYRMWTTFMRHWKPFTLYRPMDPLPQISTSISTLQTPPCFGGNTDHLQQVFITRNAILCRAVKKNFLGWSHTLPEAKHFSEKQDSRLPEKFQDVDFSFYPLFLTSKHFLLMLDASLPGKPFFPRRQHGELEGEIENWTNGNENSLFMSNQDNQFGANQTSEISKTGRRNPIQKQRITYEVFVDEFWPRLCKSKMKCQSLNPALVWEEISSFILGSFESLKSENGYLNRKDYLELGRKRASNFLEDRDFVYDYFEKYQKLKRDMNSFDDGDLIYNLYQRLQKLQKIDWKITEIYVDETQDFTQAELWLLLNVCENPNRMFLTGDTAQCIMRGISFRFEDLKSLFYYANEADERRNIVVPKNVYQLTHNYRSHSGILELAASVIDLMVTFFPLSFDRLEKDQGLFPGPKPVLIIPNTFEDLAFILTKKNKTSEIEFGANQVVIVSNPQAKETLPRELKGAIVLTIFESKGLEFNDVLLYNFFKDSQSKKEWRVVTSHLNDIIPLTDSTDTRCNSLVVVDQAQTDRRTSRPLEFDQSKHKVLNSDLKHLYTALTRARTNVWIFDEDKDTRTPMFEYFTARELVKNSDVKDLDSDSGQESEITLEKSTPAEWEEQGNKFYNQGLFEAATTCYKKAGNTTKERVAKAQESVKRTKDLDEEERRDKFLFIALEFLKANMLPEALKCLQNAQETDLATKVTKKLEDIQPRKVPSNMGEQEEQDQRPI